METRNKVRENWIGKAKKEFRETYWCDSGKYKDWNDKIKKSSVYNSEYTDNEYMNLFVAVWKIYNYIHDTYSYGRMPINDGRFDYEIEMLGRYDLNFSFDKAVQDFKYLEYFINKVFEFLFDKDLNCEDNQI